MNIEIFPAQALLERQHRIAPTSAHEIKKTTQNVNAARAESELLPSPRWHRTCTLITCYPGMMVTRQAHSLNMSLNPLLQQILHGYHDDEQLISSHLKRNKALVAPGGHPQSLQPKGVVICSIWEYDDSLLSTKMFGWSLESLISQSTSLDIGLDFIVVINNGGGMEPRIREELASQLPMVIREKLPHHTLETVVATPPASPLDRTAAWTIHSELFSQRDQERVSAGRVLVVNQPHHASNKGKISSLRDATNFLKKQVINHSYYAEFIFQMDAETILRFSKPPFLRELSPFSTLYSFFAENNYTAVGTRDRFCIFDTSTGLPISSPVGTLQLGWEILNSERSIITLPGGALMAKPSSYVAAMIHLAKSFPSLVTEDYAYTRLLQSSVANTSKSSYDIIALHPEIEHVNRTPSKTQAALSQIETWRKQTNAIDYYFQGNTFVPMGWLRMSWLIFLRRIYEVRYFGMRSVVKLFKDAICFYAANSRAYTRSRAVIE